MESARHDKRYATSGIAAHPFDYAQWQALAKNARMGQPPFVMGKEEQSMEKDTLGPPGSWDQRERLRANWTDYPDSDRILRHAHAESERRWGS